MCDVVTGKFRFLPIDFPFCDVRDVAEAHLQCVLNQESDNKRFILAQSYPMKCLADNLKDKFGASYNISKRGYPALLLNVASHWDTRAFSYSNKIGKRQIWDTWQTTQILGIR